MYLRRDVNEYGVPVTWIKCDYCGEEVSICPALENTTHPDNLKGCLIYPCESYDPKRDIDIIFMSDKELANHAPIVDINMLRKRKDRRNGINVLQKD